MDDFKTALTPQTLDPYKRVNYSLGLVLGEDEFRQEQRYFLERDQLHNRALHGYGTVHGLRVDTQIDAVEGVQVVVSSGLAVDPHGRFICVPEAQCATLNNWLSRYPDEVAAAVGPPPGSLSLYVVLCYQECATDKVPVPGGPCRSQEDSMAASRIADDFELRLTLERPPHREEAAVRRFGALLNSVEVLYGADPLTEEELEDLLSLVRERVLQLVDESPPGGIEVPVEVAPEILRAMYHVWITEVRPQLIGEGRCGGPPSDDPCVMLACLDLEVAPDADGVG